MWPFNKKKNIINTLVMVRYTYDAWKILFPESTREEWEKVNSPEDISNFTKISIRKAVLSKSRPNNALVATIDNEYIKWMNEKQKPHSLKTLSCYIDQRVNNIDFWSQRLCESGMTATYNVLGIPSLLMLTTIDRSSTTYSLSRETTDQIVELLKTVYESEQVFSPGWIVKGKDMPSCNKDVIQLAELFWTEGTRVRLGRCLEQTYDREELKDKFKQLYFVVPFVVKANLTSAHIDLGRVQSQQNSKTLQAMTSIQFTERQRMDLFKLISNDVPQVVSIGPNAVMAGQAYLSYQMKLMKTANPNVVWY